MFCIDHWIAEKLREEDNASALVNGLLTSHYKDNRTDADIIKDVKQKIKDKARAKHVKELIAKQTAKEIKMGFRHVN